MRTCFALLLFLFMIIDGQAVGFRKPAMKECMQKIDLILVLDGSFSVTSENFELVKQWIKLLVMDMHLDQGHIQIGVVQYSYYNPQQSMNEQRYIVTEIELGQYSDPGLFNCAVDRIQYQGYQTYTAHALNRTLNRDFVGAKNRYPEAKRVLILLTDGKATDSDELPLVVSHALNEMGVVLYAVGVGRYDESELLLITGNNSARVFQQKSFEDLHKIVSDLQVELRQSCDCNPEGSLHMECDACTQQCECKSNVIGRRCDQCVENFYSLRNAIGCIECGCSLLGSTNSTCNALTGQCNCKRGFAGLKCHRCADGYFGYPKCKLCQCTGFSKSCDKNSGVCSDCKDGRRGNYCELCKAGYFSSSKNGTCEPCSCNGNANLSDPDSCDPTNGRCLKCLYHTTGKNCQKCKDCYYGNAFTRSCQACRCNLKGTVPSTCRGKRCTCSPVGACKCLPNVVGALCDRCAPNTWRLRKGVGCVNCKCHKIGTNLNTTCDQSSGKCSCKEGYVGKHCSKCRIGYERLNKKSECLEMLLDQPITKELFAAPTQIATMSIASKTTTTTTTKTTTRKKHLPVNPDWSPCVTCGGGRQWPSYCRGWLCRRRWPYHQQYPSPRRCYSWNWSCRNMMQQYGNQNYYQPNFNTYSEWNEPSYYRGYNHHTRRQVYQQQHLRAGRFSLYKN